MNVSYEGKTVCQFLEAPGEHFFSYDIPNEEYPTYFNQILNGEYRKIFVFFFEPEMLDSARRMEKYASKISRLIEERIRPNRDNVIIVLSKCDLLPYFRGGMPVAPEYRNALYGNPSFSELRSVLQKSGLRRVPVVPFSAGSFTDDGTGRITFIPSREDHPKRLWGEIYECVVGRPWWKFW